MRKKRARTRSNPIFERIAVPLAAAGSLDLITKREVVASFVLDERRTIVPHLLDLTFVENTHGAMGLFGDRPILLVSLAIAVLAFLWFLLRATVRRSPLAQIGFGLVVGGALGNVIDRMVHGYVVDFIALPHFYVFNVADCAISVGLAFLALPAFARPQRATVPT